MAKAQLASSGPIAVYVEVEGPRTARTLLMALDTGAVRTVIPVEIARAIGYDPAVTKRVEIVTASGVEFVPLLTVQAVRFVGQTVRKVEVVCHDLPPQSPVRGLLGLNFLRHFNVHLNFLFRQLVLHPMPSRAT